MEVTEQLARRVKLHDLRVLLAAAELGSLGKAASRLAITQPAVSKTVSELEGKLGVRLLDRNARGVAPTPEGSMLLARAANIFAELRYLAEEIEHVADPAAGELRIACGPIFAAGFLPAVLDRLALEKPGLRYEIMEAASARALRERSADIMVGRPLMGGEGAGIEFEELYEERIFVVAGTGHPLAGKRRLAKADLAGQRWILPPADTPIGRIVEPALSQLGVSPETTTIRSMSGLLRFALLRNGHFLTTLPGSLLHMTGWRRFVSVLPIDLSHSAGPVGLMKVRGVSLPPALRIFTQCARAVAGDLRGLDAASLTAGRPSSPARARSGARGRA
jgi:DNA-binding transcriptional LysR family regulator